MKSGWGNAFGCPNCGSQNVTGARFCGSCGANLFYNCPDCRGWVDVTFSHCPNCRAKLDWPAGSGLPGSASSPAVMLLLLGVAMLLTGSIYLIVNNSGSANAISTKPSGQAAAAPAADKAPAVYASQYLAPQQDSPASSGAQDPVDYPWYDPSTRDTASYETVLTIPAGSTPASDSYLSTPASRSYLDTVYPTWGHCVGGSCRNYAQ